jgi:hypothetical protein
MSDERVPLQIFSGRVEGAADGQTAGVTLLSAPWSFVETHQLVDATRDDVFHALSDPATYPEWLVGAQKVRHVDADFPAPDAKFEHSSGVTPELSIDDSTVVVEKHGHRKLVLHAHLGPVTAEVHFDLIARGDQTEVVMRERPTGSALVLTPLVRPLLALRNRMSLRQFAERLAPAA